MSRFDRSSGVESVLSSTDYLVIGAGATGLAFADTLTAEADVDVTVVDRRDAPGGHWVDAYPFVRLHTPSAFYGVNSLALGQDRIDETGENAGFYERATGPEVFDYFARAVERLTAKGRVHVLTALEHVGNNGAGEQVRDARTGEVHDIAVRRSVVDARYLEAAIPATHAVPFEVAADARLAPINDLPATVQANRRYVVLGSGKTAADACTWLLAHGVPPDRIRWIRPRDAWFHDRRHFQPLEQVGSIMEGLAIDAEAGASAADVDDLFAHLEASGRLVRIDPAAAATMYRGTMLSAAELSTLREIGDVIRLGRVRRIEADRIVLERGDTRTDKDTVHVDCTARGLNNAPAAPVFQPRRIVLQQVRHLSPCFNAALIGFVEAHRDDDRDKNRLCPPNPYPRAVADWPRLMSRTWRTEARWLGEPDVSAWVAQSRLNLLRGIPERMDDPAVQNAVRRYLTYVGPAIQRLRELDGSSAEAAIE